MGKQDDAEIAFPSLQTDCGYVADILAGHGRLELFVLSSWKRGQRFRHFRDVAEGYESATTVSKFREILAGPIFFENGQEFRTETLMHRWQNPSPPFGDVDHCPPRRQRRH